MHLQRRVLHIPTMRSTTGEGGYRVGACDVILKLKYRNPNQSPVEYTEEFWIDTQKPQLHTYKMINSCSLPIRLPLVFAV